MECGLTSEDVLKTVTGYVLPIFPRRKAPARHTTSCPDSVGWLLSDCPTARLERARGELGRKMRRALERRATGRARKSPEGSARGAVQTALILVSLGRKMETRSLSRFFCHGFSVSCKCARGERHGPMWYLTVTLGPGRTTGGIISADQIEQVRRLQIVF